MNHHDLLERLPSTNVGSTERILTAGLGGLLLVAAYRRGSLLAGVAGGLLAARGLGGYCPAYGLWQQYQDSMRDGERAPRIQDQDQDDEEDAVTMAAEHSFPASDPPSFNPGRA